VRLLYRALLHLYPRSFRLRFETELLAAFDDERAAGRRGLAGSIALWRFILADLAVVAFRQRRRAVAHAFRTLTGTGAPHLPAHPRSSFMDTLLQDVTYSVRQFARRPGFTAVAVLSLALGIGGNSLIFGLLDGFVFNPFAYPESHRLVGIGGTFPKVSPETTYVEALSIPEYEDIKRAKAFAHIGAFDLGNRNISGGDVPERVFTAFVLDDLFPVIGVPPHLGRGFTPDELVPRGPEVAIISYRLWQSRFGGDPGIIDRTIHIGGRANTVVGVMPPDLLLIGTDLWMPWAGDPTQMPRNIRQFTIIGRLALGVSLERANTELAAIAGQVQTAEGGTFEEYDGWRLTATPWAVALLRDVRPFAFVVLGAVGFVLLIACANLANLMLARATARHRELAVRLALGAARWRIARQMLTESLLLAVMGAAAGVALAHIGLQFAEALIPGQFRGLGLEAGVNTRVLAWSAALAVLAGLLVAALPVLHATRTDPHESLKSDGRTGQARGAVRTRHALIVAEVALSAVLLLGAGLLARSFLNMQAADPGFNASGVLTMRLTLPPEKYPSGEAVTAFFEQLTERVQAVPGVRSAAMASQFPPAGFSSSQIEVEGLATSGATIPTAQTTIASRDYFRALEVPVRRGRTFTTADGPGTPARIVVNETFAARYLPGRDPIGARTRPIGRRGPGPWFEIIGVVGDARNGGVGAPVRPEVFISMERGRDQWNQLFLLVRSEQDASALTPTIRQVVASLDPEQPVYAIQTLEEAMAVSSFQERISAVLLAIFAATALALAAIGIYGVTSYSVTMRTQEIGVRMAVGAERSDVMRLVLAQVLKLATLGLLIGVALVIVAGGALQRMLYGVTPADPLTIALVTLALAGVALLAGWIPAWRASRVNPIEALRYE
jgi:putative ABC transport system permease protein